MRWPFGRKPPGFDPYATAADRMERLRQARDEVGDSTATSWASLPPMSRPGGRLVWVLVAVALVIVAGAALRDTQAPPLQRSCTQPAVELSTDSVRLYGPVTWSATGPDGEYVLTLNATAVSRAGAGRVTVTEAAGEHSWAGPVFRITNCTATGRFGVTLPPGEYTLRMFRLDPSGAEPVVTQDFTITER